ncbi:MAG: AMP-binding protein [Actinobacteria bacterium]|nr:AMP-binding protein [Actinomycetota bacterium]
MFEELDGAIATIESFVRDVETGTYDARGAVRGVERFARISHLGEAGAALFGRRADETGAYRESGARNAAEWVARKTGTNVMRAERALGTAALLTELPATDTALRAGKISQEQANEIAAAARKDPNAESELVHEAKQGISLKGLTDRCRRVRAAAEPDDEAWAKRLHDNRQLRRWVDADSAKCGMYRLSPDKGAEIDAALDAEIELILKERRANGGARESRDAYAALSAQVGQLAAVLLDQGVEPGDRVVVVSGNAEEFVVSYLAALWAGAAAVPLNPLAPPAELEREFASVAPRLVLAHGPAVSMLGAVAAKGVVPVDLDALPAKGATPLDRADDDLAVLLFTSGTAARRRLRCSPTETSPRTSARSSTTRGCGSRPPTSRSSITSTQWRPPARSRPRA